MSFHKCLVAILCILLTFSTCWAQNHLWSQRFGDSDWDIQAGRSVVVDNLGNVVIAGEFSSTVDFGGDPLTSADAADGFLAKFDTMGNHIWSQSFPGGDYQYVEDIAVDAWGNIVVTGSFSNSISVGDTTFLAAGIDVFVAKFDPDGNPLWSKSFRFVSDQKGRSVTVDGSGNVVLLGDFTGYIDFGGGAIVSSGYQNPLYPGEDDIFIAKFDPDGNHLWSSGYGDPELERPKCVATDPWGNILVTGFFFGDLDFGGPMLSTTFGQVFVAKLDPNGAHIWSSAFGDSEGFKFANSVACDGAGNVILAGNFKYSIDFGGGPLTSTLSSDLFLVKLDSNGNHIWSRQFGESGDQIPEDVITDALGNVAVTGISDGAIDFGGGPLLSAGGYDIFVAKFSPNGAHTWSSSFGDGSYDYGEGVAIDGSGDVIATGYFETSVDFGGGPLLSAGGYDIFLAKFGTGTVPTQLKTYSANCEPAGIKINWNLTETGEGTEFFVLRAEGSSEHFREIYNPAITDNGLTFEFIDRHIEPGTAYRYRVEVSDEGGRRILFETEAIATPRSSFAILQCHPNPFNPSTTITYSIAEAGPVRLEIYDAQGRLVSTLLQESKAPGEYTIAFSGRDAEGAAVASGVYFVRLESAGHARSAKIVLLK